MSGVVGIDELSLSTEAVMFRQINILVAVLLVGALVPAAVHGQTTWYVDDDAPTGGDSHR